MNYQKYADKAFSKIKQYGSPITVKRAGKKVYDPATNKYVDNGEEFNGHALKMNYDQKNVDGTNVRMGDVRFMAALDGVPKSGDEAVFAGEKWSVVSVQPCNMDGAVDIYFNIQARR